MNKNKLLIAYGAGMSEQIKESMKIGLVTIGVIVVVGLVGWLGYEMSTIRGELAKGMSWMSSFM